MSGILNKKIDFIDLVITEEGRRQMAQGGFTPTFASFTDKHIDYQSLTGSTSNAATRFYLQTPSSLSDDKIVYETDDTGKLISQGTSEEFTIIGDDLFAPESNQPQTLVNFNSVSGSAFSSTVKLVKDEVLKSFVRNKFTRTVSGFEVDGKNFTTSKNEHTFVISNSVPFPKGPYTSAIDIDSAETFMFDSKLAHNKNFQYLPPVNTDGTNFGEHQDFRSLNRLTFEDIKASLGILKMPEVENFVEQDTVFNYDGHLVIKNRAPNLPFDSTLISREHAQIYFTETSEGNNFIGQFYEEEKENGMITKLDIVDAGVLHDPIDEDRPAKHVFYVGKILFDSRDIPTFVNVFTIILD